MSCVANWCEPPDNTEYEYKVPPGGCAISIDINYPTDIFVQSSKANIRAVVCDGFNVVCGSDRSSGAINIDGCLLDPKYTLSVYQSTTQNTHVNVYYKPYDTDMNWFIAVIGLSFVLIVFIVVIVARAYRCSRRMPRTVEYEMAELAAE